MARPLRIEFENAWYHVMNRGTDRCAIFTNDLHRQFFLTLLKETVEMFGIEIHGYCLMGNHYHLLVKTPRANLSRAMRHIDGVYTQRYNRKENRDGPLFRGRYKAILIDAENYLVAVSRYIHRNPLEAGLSASLIEYEWSSYRAFIGLVQVPQWLNTRELLSYVHPEGVLSYRELVENPLLPSAYEYQGDTGRLSPILGSDEFREHALAILSCSHHPEIPTVRIEMRPTSVHALLRQRRRFLENQNPIYAKEKETRAILREIPPCTWLVNIMATASMISQKNLDSPIPE